MTRTSSADPLYNWLQTRGAGVLLHPSSLPSDTGIGNLGSSAYRFIDFLNASGMRIWQICPLGPTGYGDSPYQCFSAFAGNPYFLDLQPLLNAGFIESSELADLQGLPTNYVDYGSLYSLFWPIVTKAFERFQASGLDTLNDYGSLTEFRADQGYWLEDYSLFTALKERFDGKCWLDWPASHRNYERAKTQKMTSAIKQSVDCCVFLQYLFYAQLKQLRAYAGSKGVEILGDAPIFVALDSADVWANRSLFQLDKSGHPKAVAGVPPDYFSEDGQLWGNPLYDWTTHQESDFAWWIERIRSNLEFYDIVRLDHFRGFESYWSVPAKDENARGGRWVQSPGIELFKALSSALPDAKLIAEDLGVITEKVNSLRTATGLPGMAVLQFAFGGDADNTYLPHNYDRNCVVYSGTHDNDTTLGWYQQLDEGTKDHIRSYLNISGEFIAWDFIRTALRSSAHLAIFPLQDIMSLDSSARLNTPGSSMGNWQWRFSNDQLNDLWTESSAYLNEQVRLYGRV